MAYSQEIIQFIADKVAAIPIAGVVTSVPTFYTKEMWDMNSAIEDKPCPMVILDRPLEENTKLQGQGVPLKSYTIRMFIFAGAVELNADHATYKEPLLLIAEGIKTALLKLLGGQFVSGVGVTEPIASYKSVEIPENSQLDSNPVGLMLEVPMTFKITQSIC